MSGDEGGGLRVVVFVLILMLAAFAGYFVFRRMFPFKGSPGSSGTDADAQEHFSPPDGVIVMPVPRLTVPKTGSSKKQPSAPPSPIDSP